MIEKESGPEVDAERLRHVYGEMKKMNIHLDDNPIEYGPKRFNHKIAQTQAMLSRLEQIFLQVSEDLHWFKRHMTVKKAIFEMERKELLATDMGVRSAPNQTLRDALVDSKLSDSIREIQDLEVKAQDLEMLMIVIKAKRTDLKNTQGRLRDQLKLIEHDIHMGAQWGRSTPPSSGSFRHVSESVSDIDNLLASVDQDGGFSSKDSSSEEDSALDSEEESEEEILVVDVDPSPHLEEDHGSVLDTLERGTEEESSEILDLLDSDPDPLPIGTSSDREVDAFLEDMEDLLDTIPEAPDLRVQADIEDLISSLTD
jgi:hypothetical protein